ncbi:MAG TPA: hypothetical protein VII74_02705 [Chthoniobacterales bacterium]
MEADAAEMKSESESALFFGAIVTGVLALLPYVNVFIFPAYVIGAVVAVRSAARSGRPLDLKEGAKLGFLSTLFGSMVAVLVADLIWVIFDYQLWQHQNAQLMLAIVGHFAGPVTIDTMSSALAAQAVKPFQWPLLIAQIFGNLFLCGLFGTLTGLIAAKVCRPKTIR